jgi:hypothetical protein
MVLHVANEMPRCPWSVDLQAMRNRRNGPAALQGATDAE